MSKPVNDAPTPAESPRGNFDAEVNVRRTKDTHPHLRATLTRASDGKSYTASLWMTVEDRPHPDTGEIVKTRVLSGPLQATDLKAALDGMTAPREKGTPGKLGTNRVKLVENLSAAAAALLADGKPNEHRQATFFGLANMDGTTERVAGWEVNTIDTLPGKLLGNTQPFTPRASADEVVVEEARPAPRRRVATAPRAGQGTA